jgi:hypothetical protein
MIFLFEGVGGSSSLTVQYFRYSTGWMAREYRFDFQQGRDFFFSTPSMFSPSTIFPAVTWLWHETHCLFPPSAEIKNLRSQTTTLQMSGLGWWLRTATALCYLTLHPEYTVLLLFLLSSSEKLKYVSVSGVCNVIVVSVVEAVFTLTHTHTHTKCDSVPSCTKAGHAASC